MSPWGEITPSILTPSRVPFVCSCGSQRRPENPCHVTLTGLAEVLPWITPLLHFCKSAQCKFGISSQQCPKVSIKPVCERREGRGRGREEEGTFPPCPRTPMQSHSTFSPHRAACGRLRQGMKRFLVSSKNSIWREQLGRWQIRSIKEVSPSESCSNLPYFLLQYPFWRRKGSKSKRGSV